ncbi:MAG: polyprenyl synthetase family protein [Salinivirgaceae bacterium]|jgi:geranylgeranyl diphosphate synthase type II|nr:polyprenyl synthetase family protein [Bacteroidales bacterium]
MKVLTYTEIQEHLNRSLEAINYGFKPKNLYDPIRYSMSVGGKRIRPILTILSAQIFGANYEKALPAALAIEIFHNSTLLHDDIMDKSSVRRGQPTVYKKWNTNIAILAGDAMIIQAYKHLSDVDPKYISDIANVFNKTNLQVCEGQQYDLDYENEFSVRIEDYIEMIRLKTSVLLAASAKIGAIIGEATVEEQDILYDFGENLGLAFQLQDDYLDAFGDTKTFGKKIGDDIITKKRTFLLIKALELSKGEYHDLLIGLINNEKIKEKEKIDKVIEIYRKLNIDKITNEYINKHFNKAFDNLTKLKENGYDIEPLIEYCKKLSARKN